MEKIFTNMDKIIAFPIVNFTISLCYCDHWVRILRDWCCCDRPPFILLDAALPAVWQLCDTQPKHKWKPGRFRHSNDLPAHEKCSAHLMRQPFSPLRETRSLPFSFQKSLSLSEWPFTAGPFAKCLSPQQSSSDQCEQSGQMIFRNDLLSNSSQFTFLCPESPRGVIQAAGGPRSSQRHFKPCLRRCVLSAFSLRFSLSSPQCSLLCRGSDYVLICTIRPGSKVKLNWQNKNVDLIYPPVMHQTMF